MVLSHKYREARNAGTASRSSGQDQVTASVSSKKHSRCSVCLRDKDRKTRAKCKLYCEFICPEIIFKHFTYVIKYGVSC